MHPPPQKTSSPLPPSHLTLLLLVSPSFLKKNIFGGKSVAVLPVLLAPFHTPIIPVSFCSITEQASCGLEKKISIFQGKKIR